MLERFFKDRAAAERLRLNPLGSDLESFAALVSRLGYSRSTVRAQLWLLADLGRWLNQCALGVRDLAEGVAGRFIRGRGRSGRLRRDDTQTLRLFLDHLRAEGVVAYPEPKVDGSPLGLLRTRYEEHLRRERGVSTVTASRYWPFLRRFLLERFGDGPIRTRELRPQDISRFLRRHAHSRPKVAQLMVSALRSFFRFLFQRGETESDLSAAVLTVPSWRLAELPRHLNSEEVERLLESCDRSCSIGRRDYAVLVLLARLGLRGGEVVRLELDDIDWRAGELTVRGKGAFHDRLPLPGDVGAALAAYLRNDRPQSSTRRVFIRTRAPHRGFNHASTVSTIVRRAVERSGLDPSIKGAHLLRHSLATDMLRKGASMSEIGEILRHRNPSTTEIYAKVDIEGLRSIAKAWPNRGGSG